MPIKREYCRWCSEETEHVGTDCMLCRFRAKQAMEEIYLTEIREAEGMDYEEDVCQCEQCQAQRKEKSKPEE